MDKISALACALLFSSSLLAQHTPAKRVNRTLVTNKIYNVRNDVMTPEKLWELGRVNAEGLSFDGKHLIYGVSNYSFGENKSEKNLFIVPVEGGEAVPFTTEAGAESVVQVTKDGNVIYLYKGQLWLKSLSGGDAQQLTSVEEGLENVKISPDGKHILFSRAVLVKKYHSPDKYPDLAKSNVYIYDNLDYRHWDSFNDGRFNHPFVASYDNGKIGEPIDLLADQPFYSPQAPFGGAEDLAWTPDSKAVLYVSKKKFGKEYAVSTNTDIFRYELASKTTTNLTEGMVGYDTHPLYSPDGQKLAWLSMKTDGYEADKTDLIVFDRKSTQRVNLTAAWDGTVNSFIWSKDGRKLYFTAPTRGTVQLFELEVGQPKKAAGQVKQISEGQFDIGDIVGEVDGALVVSSTTLTRAVEIYLYDLKKKSLRAITKVNDAAFSKIAETKVEGRFTKASDGADLFSWVIYPPNFDPNKKYPTLLFCQGGPQSATTLGYSFRWNFQLMASQGYIVILPNRRGMPGWGVKWNQDISKDWGGQPIRDYLSAVDDLAKEPYVDKARIGAVGASYGGYSVFMLAAVHDGRFKSLISHCGLFDMTSWYGTTEELFFANYDLGGPYWDKANEKTYTDFNPIKHVDKWNTPILIFQGGKDFRVPIGQGLEAFQAAQLKNIKSRLVYLPEENHWVLSGHNAQVWQREFFGWLKETL
ncbi:alpha/beta hydrolase family protein [Sphingobacterium deserti]|uniref:Peptidase S9 prolyl oligopeptidase active site domain protein n=1 Tax=Sphingobacterium deserti TaxID=1229276 RepID=A0A0B8T7H3_9SPHI|nr:S9 family peptidase [Sphingobacterium deserti]KGE13655.1 peptidase S9 prolyl oligopeptidase active site domain protein [Sphingobacterium deserti]